MSDSSAYIGLVGVMVGAALTWVKDLVKDRLMKRDRARYLAIMMACRLDEFLGLCIDVAHDTGMEEADGNRVTKVSRPEDFPLPTEVDWQSIDAELMYRVLSLPSKVKQANRIIEDAGENAMPPDWDEYYNERAYQFSCLGIEADSLASEFRRQYQIRERSAGRSYQFLKKLHQIVDERIKSAGTT